MFLISGTHITGSFLHQNGFFDSIRFCVRHAAILLVLICPSLLSQPPELPSDIDRLSELLRGGEIDSSQYENLLDLYALPLSVPQGELEQLLTIFPSLDGAFPITEQLQAYSPWGTKDIQKFFDDYPALEAFRPVLRFNVKSGSEKGEVVFTLNRSRWDQISGQRLKFKHSLSRLNYSGTVRIDESVARWQKRSLGVNIPCLDLVVGNFRNPFAGSLFFGKFGTSENGDSSSLSNWIYGSRNYWNGISLEVFHPAHSNRARGMFFYHVRPSETGWGAGMDMKVTKWARLFGGFSEINTAHSCAQKIVHFYSELKYRQFKARIETGTPLLDNSKDPPLKIMVNCKQKRSLVEYNLEYFPRKTKVPISRLRQSMLRRMDEEDRRCAVVRHSFRIVIPSGENVRFSPDMELSGDGEMIHRLVSSVQLQARMDKIDLKVKQVYDYFSSEMDSVCHCTRISAVFNPDMPIELKFTGRSTYSEMFRNSKTRFLTHFCYGSVSNFKNTAYFRGVLSRDNFDIIIGIKSDFTLYEKTWTSLTVEKPLLEKGWDNVQLRGASGFLF